jgi:hypothetical protein
LFGKFKKYSVARVMFSLRYLRISRQICLTTALELPGLE